MKKAGPLPNVASVTMKDTSSIGPKVRQILSIILFTIQIRQEGATVPFELDQAAQSR